MTNHHLSNQGENPSANPYVGPRTFTEEEGDRFFGRNREARDLFSLVLSERLVLFYAQSGAGKSSLINTRLLPMLREAGFNPLPIGRVSGSLPAGIETVANIYVFNLILQLAQNERDPAELTGTTLTAYLQQTRPQADPAAEPNANAATRILIIDQFEEILTTNLERWQQREDFFRQLAQALQDDPLLWVVLSMREDYVAPLDPYARFLPGKLRTRFYMQRLGRQAALEAIEQPATRGGRPFASGVAEKLANNLAQIRVRGQTTESHLGEFVEPVQLQVVCFQLWENLKERPVAEITEEDLAQLGDIDTALAQFYEQIIDQTIQQTGVSEIDLRNWFQSRLITEAGTRGLVYRGQTQTGGLPNRVADFLAGKYLLRSEIRAGGIWYELVHDRFIEPILRANQTWRLDQPLIQIAQNWVDAGRGVGRLLPDEALQEVLTTNWQGLGPLVREFVEASQQAHHDREAAQEAERETQRRRELEQAQDLAEAQMLYAEDQAAAAARLRQRNTWLRLFGAIAFVLMVLAIGFGILAQEGREDALYAQGTAVAERQTAVVASTAAAINAAEYLRLRDNQPTVPPTSLETPDFAATKTSEAVDLEGTAGALRATLAVSDDEASEFVPPTEVDTPTPGQQPEIASTELPPRSDDPSNGGPPPPPTYVPTPTPDQAAEATAEANRRKLNEIEATQTANAGLARPPFPFGQVVKQPDSDGSLLLRSPSDSQSGIDRVPADTTVRLLAEGPGISTFGSGIWYHVEVLDGDNSTPPETGWLPKEAVQELQESPAATSACRFEPQGDFRSIWEDNQAQLGCPLRAEPDRGFFTEQHFERGEMYQSQLAGLFVVRFADPAEGWLRISGQELQTTYGDNGSCRPDPPPPADVYMPMRGFGSIWCNLPEVQQGLGYATSPEKDGNGNAIQEFEKGLILRDSEDSTYVFLTAEKSYFKAN